MAFVDRINATDVDGILQLISDDHEFVDSLGHKLVGKDKIRAVWEGYFGLMHGYRIEIEHVLCRGHVVGLFGSARGVYAAGGEPSPENAWSTHAAWLAVIENGRIRGWQVYADNSSLLEIMRRSDA